MALRPTSAVRVAPPTLQLDLQLVSWRMPRCCPSLTLLPIRSIVERGCISFGHNMALHMVLRCHATCPLASLKNVAAAHAAPPGIEIFLSGQLPLTTGCRYANAYQSAAVETSVKSHLDNVHCCVVAADVAPE